MATSDNILQQVATYQESALALLTNSGCFINKSNKKFKDFEKLEANLGATVNFDLPPKFATANTLVANFQGAEQRVQALTVDQASNVAYSFSAEQFIFNVDEYMDRFGRSATAELASHIEGQVAQNTVINHTYRFYGDASASSIDTFKDLANALTYFRTTGSSGAATVILPDVSVPAIVDTGLTQFATNRNNEMANSWELGSFSNADFNSSNLLPLHTAGSVGNGGQTLTVVSISADGATLTCSGATASDAGAIKKGDLLEFHSGSGLKYLTQFGHQVSSSPVQIRATADVAADGSGNVAIPIYPALVSTPGAPNQNINAPVAASQELSVLPNHRAGLIFSSDALFLGMPKLPNAMPFPTANENDPDTGCSMRMYYGNKFGENEYGFIHDCIWGSTLVDDYAMRLIFPA